MGPIQQNRAKWIHGLYYRVHRTFYHDNIFLLQDIASQEVIGTVVTSFLDDHGVGQEAAAASPVVATPKSVRADPVNRRHRKRDAPDRDDGVSQEQKAEQQVSQ